MSQTTLPDWAKAYRIVSSAFPPISVFEDVLDPADLEQAYLIEGLTNDRLREEAGLLSLVAPEDRVSGPGASPLMAAFTHIGCASRFTDGQYGVYYCASSLKTAIAETRYHKERFLRATQEPSLELTLRVYVCKVVKPLLDIRQGHEELHDPDPASYPIAQRFAAEQRKLHVWGLLYRSVRHAEGECAALFRPPAASLPTQGVHLRYVWDEKLQQIVNVFEIKQVA
ncbi:RES family NAD+ phosphorylase [Pseudomonas sp. UL073]|uniref:RES family NAD+ phosphorylase n=1 Tax=Zestomonas insulae TaxID=2809017 RepID=A0ABS2IFT1_9GAMM|nr:RES family NAD+ phosphorylase [Pseudomonas insulae]MBM7061947.1 RES family NAD+ phosphorylase [Pseudomonas insulae]